ncbi:MAG: hypothetical protein HQ518_30525 [Rhodopirellula sp.]|nr:hypothetical protein [Rhodopirellula sp.]
MPRIPDVATAMNRLIEGNDRFVEIVTQMQERTLGRHSGEPLVIPVSPVTLGLPLFEGVMPTQAPFAAIVGCADARVPTEAIFDESFNSLFVLRIAGNVLGSEGIGSLHYALANLGESLRTVLILGHAKCGAVTAAVDAYLSPEAYVDIASTHALRTIVDGIQIAVRGAARALTLHGGGLIESSPDYRSLLVAVSVYVNAAVSALELQREFNGFIENPPAVNFSVYDFETLRVQCLPSDDDDDSNKIPRYLPAPDSADELFQYASDVAKAFLSLDDDALDRNCRLTVKM